MADHYTPSHYAHRLLTDIAGIVPVKVMADDRDAAWLWADSGAMWLTGHAGQPPRICTAPIALCAQGAWMALSAISQQRLPNVLDGHRLLGERAACAGFSRQGRTSAGGACTLYPTLDGFLALNLARDDDWDLLPALLEMETVVAQQLPGLLAQKEAHCLMHRARLLGLAAAVVQPPKASAKWFTQRDCAPRQSPQGQHPLVVDLSSLWAGPLCGQLLAECGARVIKVESITRPDGARGGPKQFYDLINSNKQSVAIDFNAAADRRLLQALLTQADIVIESARPRGLKQLGIDAEAILRNYPGKTWLSITGYGREEPNAHWIAYGDDAAVAAGLSWLCGGNQGDPVFCGDAIADPLTGLHAALLAYNAWLQGGGKLLDCSLFSVASYCAGLVEPGFSIHSESAGSNTAAQHEAACPSARVATASAVALGADNHQVFAEFCL